MMSRRRIRDLRQLVEQSDMPPDAKARKLRQFDDLEGEWADEVVRRWQRRRSYIISAPFVLIRDAILAPISRLLGKLT